MMLTGPIDVTKKLLARAKMTIADMDLIEVNEAFAAVVLRFLQAFAADPAKVNVNGGAIALGHPLGAPRNAGRNRARRIGAVRQRHSAGDLCIGAGMGTATIIERCDALAASGAPRIFGRRLGARSLPGVFNESPEFQIRSRRRRRCAAHLGHAGRSMNVITESVMDELAQVVDA